jgi:predicted membrane protein DUF2157
MNPDVSAAVARLEQDGVLTPERARLFGRVARRELVSVRPELRTLLYGGVLAVMGGVGLLVRENLDRIGPVAIAAALWLAAVGVLLWALKHAPPFSWGRAASSHLALDYMLLLGVLLTGAALAYVEVKFTPLGDAWSHHLLVMSVFAAVLAVRCDSRIVASIALSTFAAWRGASASTLEHAFWSGGGAAGPLRANAVITGVLFVGLGYALVRSGRKAHFEPVAAHLGWLLILVAVLSGVGDSGDAGTGFRLALLVIGSALAVLAFRRGRFSLFGMGLVAAYIGLSAIVVDASPEAALTFLWFSSTGIAVLVGLLLAHRAMRGRA